jgi:hypothetical protein
MNFFVKSLFEEKTVSLVGIFCERFLPYGTFLKKLFSHTAVQPCEINK